MYCGKKNDFDTSACRRRQYGIEGSNRAIEIAIAARYRQALNRAGWLRFSAKLIVTAVIAWVMLSYGFFLTQAVGQGMFPSVKDGDLCVVFRRQAMNLFTRTFTAEEIVVYRTPEGRRIGRVVAVAGDTVMLDASGVTMVNNSLKTGEIFYPTYPGDQLDFPCVVPEGYVFLLGDHRTDTMDSRDFGPIPLQDIEGKLISILRRRGI